MSDFQDFLKHRFAHVAIGAFKPGKFDEAKELYQQAIATYSNGFKGAYLFQEPGTDRGVSIIFWENVDDMTANRNETHEAILKRMAPLFDGTPTTGVYELVCEIEPPDEEATQS